MVMEWSSVIDTFVDWKTNSESKGICGKKGWDRDIDYVVTVKIYSLNYFSFGAKTISNVNKIFGVRIILFLSMVK